MGVFKKQQLHLPPTLTLQLRTMKGGVVTKLRLIVFLPSILGLWDDKGTLAVSVPQIHDNSQFPKFLVLDKPGGKKSLIEIEGKTGRKESIQKQTEEPTDALRQIEIDHDCYDCGSARQICCNFGNGTRRCDYPKNCPHLGKENGMKIDERCKEKKCGESCHPKPRVYGACDDNQQCVDLFNHPGCKQGEKPGPLCEGPPDYGSC